LLKISASSSSTARLCWKKYYWRYDQNILPIGSSVQQQQGKVIHEAFDMFYKGEAPSKITTFISSTYDDLLNGAELADQESLEVAKFTALGMWLGYPHHTRALYSVIGSEREFLIPLAHGVRLHGIIDRTLQKDGLWWVGELKTSGEQNNQFIRRIERSYQASAYVYALQQLGLKVQGVLYDIIKKPLLRKGSSETCQQFCQRIMIDYKRRPENYYYTYQTYRSPEQLKMFQKDMQGLIGDIRAHKRTGIYYRNPDACFQFNNECEYSKICFCDKPDPLILQLYFRQGGGDRDGRKKEERIAEPTNPFETGAA
jgi:hypothetical protein